MPKIIPNQNSYIGFTTVQPVGYTTANINSNSVTVTATEIASATDITPFVLQIDASQAGNMIPTPALDSLFERQIIGTTQGTLSATFYRDNTADTAWNALSKGTIGYFLISRFGGTNANRSPAVGQTVEVWPITVAQRKASSMTSNTVQTFDVMGALDVPVENAVVNSTGVAPSVPLNLVGTPGATGIAVLDWDVPVAANGTITGYKVFRSTTLGGSYTEITTNITKVGTTATLTTLTAGAGNFFKVAATNATGDSPQTAAVQVTVL